MSNEEILSQLEVALANAFPDGSLGALDLPLRDSDGEPYDKARYLRFCLQREAAVALHRVTLS